MKVPIPGIPEHIADMARSLTNAGIGMFVWRTFLILAFVFTIYLAVAASGGSALAMVIIGFVLTSLLSYFLRDDILAVWRDLWNMRWAEVEV